MFMLAGDSHSFTVAVKINGQSRPAAVHVEERPEPRHPHFAYLLHASERMNHSGDSSYPVERTLLNSGTLDHTPTPRHEGQ